MNVLWTFTSHVMTVLQFSKHRDLLNLMKLNFFFFSRGENLWFYRLLWLTFLHCVSRQRICSSLFNWSIKVFRVSYLSSIWAMIRSRSLSIIRPNAPYPRKYINSLRKSFGMQNERSSKWGGTLLYDFAKYRAA